MQKKSNESKLRGLKAVPGEKEGACGIDLHIHSRFSDGTNDLAELLELVEASGLKYFSITDHDTLDACYALEKLSLGLIEKRINYFKGIELACKHGNIDLHILGYAFCLENDRLKALVDKAKRNRSEKAIRTIEYLKSEHKIEIPKEFLDALFEAKTNVGKPDFADILIKMGYGTTVSGVIDRYLKDFKPFDLKIEAEEAVKAIGKASGFSALAHPLIIMEDFGFGYPEINTLVGELKEMGLQALEVYYGKHSAQDKREFRKIAVNHKLMMSGGSDFHGKNKPGIRLGNLGDGITDEALSDMSEFIFELMR